MFGLKTAGRRGEYGIDGDFEKVSARTQGVIVAVIGAVLIGGTIGSLVAGAWLAALITGLVALWFAAFVGSYLRATLVGKFEVWERILGGLGLRGDEHVLDLGCGRGAVLLRAAQLLPRGRAVGIDIWRADQTGNSPEVTRRNAELEGVADRVTLETGDITRLPFPDNSFDVILSSLVIHNLPDAEARRKAIDEAVRVLRPGGRLAIADLMHTRSYLARVQELGLTDIHHRDLGWRMWWGGPWVATRLLTATKPA
ncbi:class I SAM-dependent methyltransferase [Nocardia concava]|uniref:class I SAM-dependent methyltransferase n=1 Tax=Nocardia concava TaxID=257281 RepID=UPI000304C130|nr:class I SAM-dependent methyltransferase [Nocardia concava]